MALKKRIIPILLFDSSFSCVKPISFQRPYRTLGSMRQYINVIERRNVDELIILDICATIEGRSPQFENISQILDNIYCPVCVGGGIRNCDDISRLLRCGADKVAISALYSNMHLIREASEKFGKQAIVASVYEPDVITATMKAIAAECWGAGEILLTSVEKDGTMQGYDMDSINEVVVRTGIPVIANGGCSDPLNMKDAFEAGADAVAAGSLFQFTDVTPRDCAIFLNAQEIDVRI